MRLKDRVAIVTGGGGGIGEGICLCLAREGAHVVVGDQNRTSAERVAVEILKMGRRALAVQTDVRSACVFQHRKKRDLRVGWGVGMRQDHNGQTHPDAGGYHQRDYPF